MDFTSPWDYLFVVCFAGYMCNLYDILKLSGDIRFMDKFCRITRIVVRKLSSNGDCLKEIDFLLLSTSRMDEVLNDCESKTSTFVKGLNQPFSLPFNPYVVDSYLKNLLIKIGEKKRLKNSKWKSFFNPFSILFRLIGFQSNTKNRIYYYIANAISVISGLIAIVEFLIRLFCN